MGTFNITQTPISKDLYIYPESNDTVQLTPIGVANNFDCVNDTVGAGDDDTTYVYTNGVSTVSDLYTLSDHTTETGIINSVTLYTKCKSHQYNQSSSGTYELLLGVKDASAAYYTYYKSSETSYGSRISPTTDYQIFSCLWMSNLSTQNSFTWTDIDNLKMGIRCSSPSIYGVSKQSIFRPNAYGDLTQLNYNNNGTWVGGYTADQTINYTMVDEVTSDDVGTYVYAIAQNYTDLYDIPNHTIETGIIQNVSLFYKIATHNSSPADFYPKTKIGGITYSGDVINYGSEAWQLYSYVSASNPSNNLSWQWHDIDSMQIGIQILNGGSYEKHCCTQLYAVVNYLDTTNPDIRTTQCYAKINYNPGSSTCTLHKPQNYSISHRRDVKKINTWNNSRYVYDCGRLGKTLNMNGLEYTTTSSEASIALGCVKTMKDNSVKVTLSGFNDDNVNGDWFIRNFNFEKNTPIMYTWDMELEKA